MATAVAKLPKLDTLEDLIEQLGGIPTKRIRLHPPLGTATEIDVLAAAASEPRRLCELIDGMLVEKAVGYSESVLAVYLLSVLNEFVRVPNLGLVTGEAGMMQLFAGCVRIPDVAFVSWDRIPGRKVPQAPIPNLAPNLAVEVLSRGNTKAEMERKRHDYFKANVQIVWEIDPSTRTVNVYTAPGSMLTFAEGESLDGGSVLPGLTIRLADLFAELDRHG